MAETKYGQYVIEAPTFVDDRQSKHQQKVTFRDNKPWSDWRDINFSVNYRCITEPIIMAMEPHEHDHEQFLFFLGGNPEDVKDLGAEIEVTLGEEEEKHIVKTASIVRIPKGLRHGPFNFKRVDKPIVFMNVTLSPEYSRVRGNMCEHS
jgi:mannose-6-phosphate isomerase-like protein (cupin superfamily)